MILGHAKCFVENVTRRNARDPSLDEYVTTGQNYKGVNVYREGETTCIIVVWDITLTPLWICLVTKNDFVNSVQVSLKKAHIFSQNPIIYSSTRYPK